MKPKSTSLRLLIGLFLILPPLLLTGCATQRPSLERPHQVVFLAGDSLMEGLGPVIERTHADKSRMLFILGGRSSSGLCNTAFHDWISCMRKHISVCNPDFVAIALGTNDDQALADSGKHIAYGSKRWDACYAEKVAALLDIAGSRGAHTIWLLPPAMGDPAMDARVRHIRTVIKAVCDKRSVPTFDMNIVLGDTRGRYRRTMRSDSGKEILLRTRDGVHIANAGNRLLAKEFATIMTKMTPTPHPSLQTR